MAVVVLTTVTKFFENVPHPVLNEVSFEVKDQEFMVLVGLSGCGTSTTLRMIADLEGLARSPADRRIPKVVQ